MKIKKVLIFLMIILVLFLISNIFENKKDKEKNEFLKEKVFVKKVLDGDTFETKEGYKIRLLGINTPEKKDPNYEKAKSFLKQIENKTIEVLKDKEEYDKYNRKLRYVFYENRFINLEILEQGLANSFMISNLYYKDKFKIAEDFARKNEIGIWEKSKDNCAKCIKLEILDKFNEYFIIKNVCPFDCKLKGWTVKDEANNIFYLNDLKSNQSEKYESKKEIWNNEGDRFFMKDDKGKLVIFEEV